MFGAGRLCALPRTPAERQSHDQACMRGAQGMVLGRSARIRTSPCAWFRHACLWGFQCVTSSRRGALPLDSMPPAAPDQKHSMHCGQRPTPLHAAVRQGTIEPEVAWWEASPSLEAWTAWPAEGRSATRCTHARAAPLDHARQHGLERVHDAQVVDAAGRLERAHGRLQEGAWKGYARGARPAPLSLLAARPPHRRGCACAGSLRRTRACFAPRHARPTYRQHVCRAPCTAACPSLQVPRAGLQAALHAGVSAGCCMSA